MKVKSLSHVWLFATPWTPAYQAPPSMGFSRQEYWSGLLFPSPMHESEKWKWSRSVVSDSSRRHGLQPTRLLRLWDSPGNNTGVGCHCLLCYGLLILCLVYYFLKFLERFCWGNRVVNITIWILLIPALWYPLALLLCISFLLNQRLDNIQI